MQKRRCGSSFFSLVQSSENISGRYPPSAYASLDSGKLNFLSLRELVFVPLPFVFARLIQQSAWPRAPRLVWAISDRATFGLHLLSTAATHSQLGIIAANFTTSPRKDAFPPFGKLRNISRKEAPSSSWSLISRQNEYCIGHTTNSEMLDSLARARARDEVRRTPT